MNTLINYAIDKVKRKLDNDCVDGNVGTSERILSVIAGGLILSIGVKQILKNPFTAISGVGLGGALVYRGITGKCTIKAAVEQLTNEREEVTVIEHKYFVK
ncbi:DUF2892 family protein [Sphingobacterium alimentarium]|uniref:DUF2892 family protein n=1 Tax=Sphingobacterium alimentarium TaxID=797292 RepID=A0A4R3W2Y6_9SPHI|nr:DUF2892 domain-containing protein [Sphingobacterium alimentarium]TCV19980.1 DUF2892 family protein [Sphingobacterium alimentarium]